MNREIGKPLMMTLAGVLAVGGLFSVVGCSNTLETGYVPRQLGVSSSERRGYYASPFTPEAAAAQQSKIDPYSDSGFRKPSAAH
jgi:hypothetical protein